MSERPDRLFELLPAIYRKRDAERGYPLRALLQVLAGQAEALEADIGQLYENSFIETADDWVVPYIGSLVGYRPVHEAGEPGEVATERGRERNKILIPRREVANTIRYRRRKGTLALFELLANDAAGWPARAVELFRLLAVAQALNHLRLDRGRTVDVRLGDALDRLCGPFDELAHTVDVRRPRSRHRPGLYNIPNVGLFVWRLRAYSVSGEVPGREPAGPDDADRPAGWAGTPAYCLEEVGPQHYSFSVLGQDGPLFTRPRPEEALTDIAGELNLPVPIRRRALAADLGKDAVSDYYGAGKSFEIRVGARRRPIPRERLVVADLTDWQYRARRGTVLVDPALGRISFPPSELPREGVWVSYHYGFSADVGGGEYPRTVSQPAGATFYRVGEDQEHRRIGAALDRWRKDQPQDAVVEIVDSGVYVEQINIVLGPDQTLQLRAAPRRRPVIRLLDWQTALPDSIAVAGEAGSRFTLDGLLVTGRPVQAEGRLATLAIRHCTLVPGWTLQPDCEPRRPAEPSIELLYTDACLLVEHSIVGSIQVSQDEVAAEPNRILISDSVVDATSEEREALGGTGWPLAHAVLTIARSTVFGQVQTHAVDLAENTLFVGKVEAGRRQRGCVRFCYVPPDSRTPRRYNCQPDLVEEAARAPGLSEAEAERLLERERDRVRPQFNSTRYGTPTYCQLALACAEEIRRGADDRSEMGVFHDLYQPQRRANLEARLAEYAPAAMEAGIFFAS